MKKNHLMKKFYFLLFFCLFTLGFGQSVQLYNPADNVVYTNEQYFCVGEKFNFKVDAVASSTGDYLMTDITDFTFSNPSGSVPFTNKIGNDHFSSPVTIPFTFNFYGTDYTQLVVGSNGRLLFGAGTDFANLNLNRYVDQMHSGNNAASTNIPLSKTPPSTIYSQVDSNDFSRNLNLAQIFMGFTDLGFYNPSYYDDKIKVGTGIYQGVNGLLITFSQALERTVGTGYQSTLDSQVLLLPDNRIIIKVNKSSSTKAILGIQNQDATDFKVPQHFTSGSDYNNGSWKSEGKAFLFTPNQNLTPIFKWLRNGAVIAGESSDTLNDFSPVDGETLKVEVTYLEDPTIIRTDEVTFKSLQTPIITTVNSTCAQVDLETPLIPDVTYEWRKVGNATVLSTTNKLSVTSTGDYIVKIIRNGSAGLCSLDSAPISLVLNSTFPPFNNSPKFICKNDGSSQVTVNLNDYYLANPTQYTLKFQENGVDLPSPNNVLTLNADQTRTIKIVAESLNTTASCSFTATFDLTFISLPVTNTEYSPTNLCFGSNTYNLVTFENEYFAGKNYQFMYSVNGGSSYQTLTTINPQVNNRVLVKIKHPNSTCETVVKLKFNFNPKVEIKPYTQFPEHCFSSSEYFDLNSTKAQLEYSPDIRATFYTDAALTNQITNLNYRGSGSVYIKVENIITGCLADSIPELDLKIYPKPALIKGTPETKYSQCGTAIFNLTTNINDYIGNWTRYSEIRYYDYAGNLLSQSEWENYDLSVRLQPYMVFVYNSTNNLQCSDRINFDLVKYKKPVSIKSQILICAEINYSLQNFKNEVIANPANYTFTDLSNNPLPANFDLSSLPKTVKYLIKNNTTGCISDPQTLTFTQGGSSALSATETDYTLCDTDFDGITPFNLDSKKSIFTTDASATFEYFKDLNLTQSITSNYTNETAFAQTIFVRITLPNFCPSTAKINLKVNIPNKSTTLQPEYFICYGETLVIDAGTENTIFTWSDGKGIGQTASFTKPGNYSVVLQKGINGCPYTHNFTISDINQPKIQVINQTNNSIEVIAEGGSKPYTYYFNGVPQSSNILLNPTQSSYEIKVKSNTGCLGPPKMVYFIKINNAFSPNGDGINDVWRIENLDKMQQVSIVIVNRNGTKVFESNNPSKSEWDGKQNGRELPTSSYWYVISWFDGVTQKTEQRQGWILLKNRN